MTYENRLDTVTSLLSVLLDAKQVLDAKDLKEIRKTAQWVMDGADQGAEGVVYTTQFLMSVARGSISNLRQAQELVVGRTFRITDGYVTRDRAKITSFRHYNISAGEEIEVDIEYPDAETETFSFDAGVKLELLKEENGG